MSSKRLIAIGVISLVVLVGTALAQEITGGFLARGTLGKADAQNDGIELETNRTAAVVARLTFEPGSSSGCTMTAASCWRWCSRASMKSDASSSSRSWDIFSRCGGSDDGSAGRGGCGLP